MNFTQRFNGFNLEKRFVGLRWGLLPLLIVVGWMSSAVQSHAGSKPPEATLRFHLQASPTMPPGQTVPVTLMDPPQRILVNKLPELNEKHLSAIERLPDGRVMVTFNTIGANLLDGATSTHMGAIMVVICDGRVVYAPVIDLPLRTGKIILPNAITDQEIMIFQQMIQRRSKGSTF